MKLLKLQKIEKNKTDLEQLGRKHRKPPPMLGAFITKSFELQRSSLRCETLKLVTTRILMFFFRFYLGYPKAKPFNFATSQHLRRNSIST